MLYALGQVGCQVLYLYTQYEIMKLITFPYTFETDIQCYWCTLKWHTLYVYYSAQEQKCDMLYSIYATLNGIHLTTNNWKHAQLGDGLAGGWYQCLFGKVYDNTTLGISETLGGKLNMAPGITEFNYSSLHARNSSVLFSPCAVGQGWPQLPGGALLPCSCLCSWPYSVLSNHPVW